MTTLIRLSRSKLCMYAGDHSPPHFHVLANDGREALAAIASLAVLAGAIDRKTMAEAIAWAENNRDAVDATWMRLNNE